MYSDRPVIFGSWRWHAAVTSACMQPARVLLTDGGAGQARSTLAAVRALGVAGYAPAVTVSAPHSLAAASRYCTRRIEVPPVGTSGYAEAVDEELRGGGYLCALPSSDAAMLALGMPVERLLDKHSLSEEARRVGIPVPEAMRFDSWGDLLAGAAQIDYPVVIKSSIMGTSVLVAHSRRALDAADGGAFVGPLLAQAYLSEELFSISGVMWEGRLIASVHQGYLRTWPPQAGGACAAVTVERDPAKDEPLARLLEGLSGVFHAQFVAGRLIDVNPRLYGSLPVAVRAGANLPAIYCDILRTSRVGGFVTARPGVHYRWLEGELRHVAQEVRANRMSVREGLRILRPRRAVAYSVESWRDPAPVLARFRHVVASGKWRGGVGKLLRDRKLH
jgi:hypothetical protein